MKPVAYAMFRDGEYYDAITLEEHTRFEGGYTIPLYTHPAKTLTDEEILKEMEFLPQTISMEDENYIAFARAILRKAQEK
jgi:hypothetical protein